MKKKQQNDAYAQRRLISAWASALSDQSSMSTSSLSALWVAKDLTFLHADGRLWSDWAGVWLDWADAQADLSLRWAHRPFCWFCHAVAQMSFTLKGFFNSPSQKPLFRWSQVPNAIPPYFQATMGLQDFCHFRAYRYVAKYKNGIANSCLQTSQIANLFTLFDISTPTLGVKNTLVSYLTLKRGLLLLTIQKKKWKWWLCICHGNVLIWKCRREIFLIAAGFIACFCGFESDWRLKLELTLTNKRLLSCLNSDIQIWLHKDIDTLMTNFLKPSS